MSLTAPSAENFPASPAAWYLFSSLRELRRGPVSKELLGGRLVAFCTPDGQVAVLNAHCSHLGADLGRGCLVGESLQCPYHGWRYNVQGECVELPRGETIPEFARQQRYPVEIRHGLVFFFNGASPLFPLPFFHDAEPEAFVAGRVFGSLGNCSWYLLAANAFDAAHMEIVHDRTLVRAPLVDTPAPYARRIRYSWRVTGDALADHFLRRFVGDHPEVSITSWGGTLTLVTAHFQRGESYLLVATRPVGPHQTMVEVVVFAPRSNTALGRLWQPVTLEVRRWLTSSFLQDDFDRLAGIRYSPHTLTSADQSMIDFFHWLADLPQTRGQTAAQPRLPSESVPKTPCPRLPERVE